MTGVGPTDHILLLLREQLRRGGRADAARSTAARAATPRQRIEALAAAKDLPERDFRRALIHGLLSEALGEELAADPAFGATAGEVLRMIEGSDQASGLLDQAARSLRGG